MLKIAHKLKNLPLWQLGLFVSVWYGVLYFTTNHTSLWGPVLLPFVWGESKIPFAVSWTPAYLSSFLQVLVALYLLKKREHTFLVGLIFLILINTIFFFLIPTHFPRPVYTGNAGTFAEWLYTHVLIVIDSPQNAFPSQHVAVALYTAVSVSYLRRRAGIVFLVWSLVIIISTLFLKQHYIVDIIGGICVGACISWITWYGSAFKTAVK